MKENTQGKVDLLNVLPEFQKLGRCYKHCLNHVQAFTLNLFNFDDRKFEIAFDFIQNISSLAGIFVPQQSKYCALSGVGSDSHLVLSSMTLFRLGQPQRLVRHEFSADSKCSSA